MGISIPVELIKVICMKLYVTRHGETDHNVLGRYSGSTDVSLNETGYAQARDLAIRLASEKIDAVVSSPMLRAKQTADIICEALNLRYNIYEQLAERGVGVFEGLTRDEAKGKYPDLWKRQCTRKLDDAPDGGETLRQGCNRVDTLIAQLRHEYKNKSVLVVCHGFISQAIHRHCNNLTIEEMLKFSLNNCEFVKYALK